MSNLIRSVLSWLLSTLIAVIAFVALLMVVFPGTGIVKDMLQNLGVIQSLESRLIWDAVLTFLALLIFFWLIFLIRKIHAAFICIFCAVSMFVFWGYESNFFFEGLNPQYPIWYETNIALNDIVAALLVIYANKRITHHSDRKGLHR